MIRLKRREPVRQAQRARKEAVSAWYNLRAAATQRAQRVGDNSRRGRDTARERANNAAMALQGKTPRSTIRKWLGAGLAAGAVVGAAGAAALGRRRNHRQVGETGIGVRDKANAAVETVRERAATAAHRTATSARDAADKVSGATKPRATGNGHQTAQMPSDRSR
jgi:hypothetical protein